MSCRCPNRCTPHVLTIVAISSIAANIPDVETITTDWVGHVVARWAELRPDLDSSPMLVIGRIGRLAALADTRLRPPFVAAGLADGDFDLLAALRRQGPPHVASPGALTTAMLVTSGATSKRLDRLESKGYVERGVSTEDGRGRIVSLTPSGLTLTDDLIAQHLRNEAEILAGLDSGEREHLGRLLERLALHIEQEETT